MVSVDHHADPVSFVCSISLPDDRGGSPLPETQKKLENSSVSWGNVGRGGVRPSRLDRQDMWNGRGGRKPESGARGWRA